MNFQVVLIWSAPTLYAAIQFKTIVIQKKFPKRKCQQMCIVHYADDDSLVAQKHESENFRHEGMRERVEKRENG